MKKKVIIVFLILVITFSIVKLYQTFAIDTSVSNASEDIYEVTLNNSTYDVNVPANSSKTVIYKLTNTNQGTVKYGVAYSGTNITVRIYSDSIDPETGNINYLDNKFIKLYISNSGSTESTATITTIMGFENGGDLIVPSDVTLVTLIYNNIPAATYINNLYTSNTTAVNNNITYNLDSTHNLMEDTAGNIRYYGASPNNYIDLGEVYNKDTTFNNWELVGWYYDNQEACYDAFDCDTHYSDWDYDTVDACKADIPYWLDGSGYSTVEEMCGTTIIPKGTPILYRIIGVFGDKIKVIRNESIGKYSLDTSASDINESYGINEWSQADLMKLLNPGYESESVGGSLWYNSASGTCYNGQNNASTECDFTSTGLSDNVKNKIAEVTWNLGGWNSNSVYPNQIYEYERGTNVVVPGITCSGTYCNDTITRTTSWTGKVALANPSDYGYAADLTQCNQTLNNYNNATCTSNNWLYNSANQWSLTPDSSNANTAWRVNSTGYVSYGRNVYLADGVRPVLYLNSDTGIVSGNGSESNPYRIS